MSQRGFLNQLLSVVIILMVLILAVNLAGCKKKLTEDEKLFIKEFYPYCTWLEDFKRSTMCYPETWDDLLRWKGFGMPENPYTGEAMVCLESAEFDPETSPGNIYYITIVRDDCVINCQVIVFGEKGELWRYTHAGPFAAK